MLVAVSLIPLSLEMWVGQPGTENYHTPENLLVGLSYFSDHCRFLCFWPAGLAFVGPGSRYPPRGLCYRLFFGHGRSISLKRVILYRVPSLKWPGFYLDFSPEIWPLLVAFAVVTVVGTIETVGDAMAIQRVSRRGFKKVDYDSVQGALYSDGVGNVLAGLARHHSQHRLFRKYCHCRTYRCCFQAGGHLWGRYISPAGLFPLVKCPCYGYP